MKYNNLFKKSSLLLVSGLLLVACQEDIVNYEDVLKDQETSTGAPVIEKITTADRGTVLTEGNLSQVVLLQGKNLSGVRKITVNDVVVDLKKEAHVSAKEISLQIPRKVPGEVTDKITVTTQLGETEADFKVNVPPLVLTGLYNEFSLPDDTTTIIGENFDLYQLDTTYAVVKLGDLDVEVIASDAKSMTVWIPPTAGLDAKKISISSPVVTEPILKNYRYGGIPINASGVQRSGDPDKYIVTEVTEEMSKQGYPPIIDGRYYTRATWPDPVQWCWWEHYYGCDYNLSTDSEENERLIQEIVNNVDLYDVKFEFSNERNHPFFSNFFFRWCWSNGGEIIGQYGGQINTGGRWMTITTDARKALCDPATGAMTFESSGDRYFTFAYNPSQMTTPDFCICNFRFVKKSEQ